MQTIKQISIIYAPVSQCFDLSRSIDLHVQSMNNFNEKAIAGKTAGLIQLNEFVTWKAKHFLVNLKLTSKITEMEVPFRFTDEMIKGPFKKMKHEHIFKQIDTRTEMIDVFQFESPFGILGRLMDKFILKNYMKNLLNKRNQAIKFRAETKCADLGQDYNFI